MLWTNLDYAHAAHLISLEGASAHTGTIEEWIEGISVPQQMEKRRMWRLYWKRGCPCGAIMTETVRSPKSKTTLS